MKADSIAAVLGIVLGLAIALRDPEYHEPAKCWLFPPEPEMVAGHIADEPDSPMIVDCDDKVRIKRWTDVGWKLE